MSDLPARLVCGGQRTGTFRATQARTTPASPPIRGDRQLPPELTRTSTGNTAVCPVLSSTRWCLLHQLLRPQPGHPNAHSPWPPSSVPGTCLPVATVLCPGALLSLQGPICKLAGTFYPRAGSTRSDLGGGHTGPCPEALPASLAPATAATSVPPTPHVLQPPPSSLGHPSREPGPAQCPKPLGVKCPHYTLPVQPPCPRGRVPGLGLPKREHVPRRSPLGSTDQHDARVGEGSVRPRTSGR